MFEGIFAMLAFYWVYWTRGYFGRIMPLPGPAEAPLLYATATAATLSSIIPGQIANVFACRSERVSTLRLGLFSNRLILLGICTELALIAAIDYLRPLQAVFGTAPLRLVDWLFLFTITPTLLAAEEGRKLLLRRAAARRQVTKGARKCDLSSLAAAG
jgi:Ca2+-transporting ATPase